MPFVYRIWRGFGIYWHGSATTVETFWRRFYLWNFHTVKYSRTRYTHVGLFGASVHVVTNDLGIPPGFRSRNSRGENNGIG